MSYLHVDAAFICYAMSSPENLFYRGLPTATLPAGPLYASVTVSASLALELARCSPSTPHREKHAVTFCATSTLRHG